MNINQTGALIKFSISLGLEFYGRILDKGRLRVFENEDNCQYSFDDIELILRLPEMFCVSIYDDFLESSTICILGYSPVRESERETLKPLFWQSISDPFNCVLVYPDGTEEKVLPEKCEGFEKLAVWNLESVIRRIQDNIEGIESAIFNRLKVIIPE